MYLYDKERNRINVYKFIPEKEKIINFKKQEIEEAKNASKKALYTLDTENNHNNLWKETINNYYNGEYDKNEVVTLQNSEYLLMLKERYLLGIYLTEKLYYLQLLLQEKFELLHDKNVDEQLKLFSVSSFPTYSINLNSIKDLIHSRLIKEDYSDIIEKVNNTSEIISKVRVLNKD